MTAALLRTMYKAVFRNTFRTYWILGSLLMIGAVTILVWGPAHWTNLVAFMVTFMAGAICLLMPSASYRQLQRKLLTVEGEIWGYTVTPDVVIEHTPQYTTSYPWGTVTGMVETPALWIVLMRPGSAVALPKAGFDPASAAAVAGLLAHHATQAASSRA